MKVNQPDPSFILLARADSGFRSAVLCLAPVCASAQTGSLPSNPSPNPSSLSNPYYGSVTLKPATDEIVRLSLDEAVQRGLSTNLGLKESEENEKTLHGQVTGALQYFLPTITATGATGYDQFNLAAFGFGPGILDKIGNLFPGLDTSTISR